MRNTCVQRHASGSDCSSESDGGKSGGDADSDDVPDEEAAEALEELQTLDVDEGVDNLIELFPPSEAEVTHLFDTMSAHLRRSLRTVCVYARACRCV